MDIGFFTFCFVIFEWEEKKKKKKKKKKGPFFIGHDNKIL
jgi:hypothetical protein